VIDLDRLTLHAPVVRHDLPGGGRRLDQEATGYVATIVNGEVIRRIDQPTDRRPGRLVRGAQAVPVPAPLQTV
jgi:N-acyl-D-aspartate/D-glutamate deacylase